MSRTLLIGMVAVLVSILHGIVVGLLGMTTDPWWIGALITWWVPFGLGILIGMETR